MFLVTISKFDFSFDEKHKYLEDITRVDFDKRETLEAFEIIESIRKRVVSLTNLKIQKRICYVRFHQPNKTENSITITGKVESINNITSNKQVDDLDKKQKK